MPRQGRKISGSQIYHIMMRGNERKALFLDEEDRKRFLAIVKEKCQREDRVYAYCLMDNHVHLVITTREISAIMKRINISYAIYFNKKYNRIGHLFQDRFKSETIEDDVYLMTVVRYIHNNPVKANLVVRPEEYFWSSFRAYKELSSGSIVVDSSYILEMFSEDRQEAVRRFLEFSMQEDTQEYLDCAEKEVDNKRIQNEGEAKAFVKEYFSRQAFSLIDLKQRQHAEKRAELIKVLKQESTLSIRQIANLLEVDRNLVQRIKLKL